MKNIHIGTSGWSYKGWKGKFYPENLRQEDYLTHYARHFKVAEINSSFYRLPTASTVQKWIEQVPKEFLFCPKISRYLSHMKKLNDPEEPLKRFFDVFAIMKKQMGPVLVQLPANVTFNATTEKAFYEALKNNYPEFSIAIEVRDESWYSEESIALMKKYHISLVMAQSELFPYKEEITAKDIYLRFHGPKELYASCYPAHTLREYSKKMRSWVSEGHRVWAFFNNDVNGYAVDNAKELMGYLQ